LFSQEFSLLPGGIQAVLIGEAHDFPFHDWMYFPNGKFRFLFANGTGVRMARPQPGDSTEVPEIRTHTHMLTGNALKAVHNLG
jgi:hypothetical protein